MPTRDVRKSLIVALDFDGVVVADRFPEIGPRIGCEEWIPNLQHEFDLKVILWTCRSDEQPDLRGTLPGGIVATKGFFLGQAIAECEAQNIKLWAVDTNPEQYTWSTANKAYAHVYIDDKCLGIPMIHLKNESKPCVDWNRAGPMLFDLCYKRARDQELEAGISDANSA